MSIVKTKSMASWLTYTRSLSPIHCPTSALKLRAALIEQMEAVWPVITDESTIRLASIALALRYRDNGVIAYPKLIDVGLQ